MRLRQLGTTQSVLFVAPPEVDRSIVELLSKKVGKTISSLDVISWLLVQTYRGIEQLAPLYYSQGTEYFQREQACWDNPEFLSDVEQREAYLGALMQIEQQSLSQFYGVKKKPPKKLELTSPRLAPFVQELNSRRKDFRDSGAAVHGSALMEVEQEREVAHQVEAVRVVQKPVHYTALQFHQCTEMYLALQKLEDLLHVLQGTSWRLILWDATCLGRSTRSIPLRLPADFLFPWRLPELWSFLVDRTMTFR